MIWIKATKPDARRIAVCAVMRVIRRLLEFRRGCNSAPLTIVQIDSFLCANR
jgi:hypothetical protein